MYLNFLSFLLGFSTDDTEDEHFETVEPATKKFKNDFKNPAQYIERGYFFIIFFCWV